MQRQQQITFNKFEVQYTEESPVAEYGEAPVTRVDVTRETLDVVEGDRRMWSCDYTPVITGSETVFLIGSATGESIGAGDGITTTFELSVPYVDTMTVYADGSEMDTALYSFTSDDTLTTITFDTPPANMTVLICDYTTEQEAPPYSIVYETGTVTFPSELPVEKDVLLSYSYLKGPEAYTESVYTTPTVNVVVDETQITQPVQVLPLNLNIELSDGRSVLVELPAVSVEKIVDIWERTRRSEEEALRYTSAQ